MKSPILISIFVFITFILISYLFKLKIFFSRTGKIKTFGLDTENNETLFSLYPISFFLSLIIYLVYKKLILRN